MPSKRLLLVEGSNDQHVIYNLRDKHHLPKVFDVKAAGSDEQVLSELQTTLKFNDDEARLERLGIIVDADVDLGKRWRKITKILSAAGYANVPNIPPATGAILHGVDLPIFGAWLMPNNDLPGKIENFISFLVPQADALWLQANSIVDSLPEKRFAPKDKIKAQIHTWLAWQKSPGLPMGVAIQERYLDPDAPMAQQLIARLQALFIN